MRIPKMSISLFIFFVVGSLLIISGEDHIREDLIITNIEVPVRVYHKGKLVDGLKKSDFTLFENNKVMEINGFFLQKKKIGSEENPARIPLTMGGKKKSRFFVLAFQLTEYNDYFKTGVSYLFEKVLRDSDSILVFVNNRTISLDTVPREKKKEHLEKLLRTESIKARQQLQKYFMRIRMNLNFTKTELVMKEESEGNLPLTTRPAQVVSFLKEYLSTWKEYKQRYLVPDIDKYYRFAEFLTRINLEKWVINFYQTEMFPVIKYGGEFRQEIEQIADEMLMSNIEGIQYSRMILKLLAEIDRELKASEDFDSEEVSRLFYKAGATFHSIISSAGSGGSSRDLEYRQVSTDIENSLRQITAKTGGKLISTRDLESALKQVSHTEDISYMLTYAPSDPMAAGKISVKVNRRNHKVVYDNNKRADYIKKYLAKKKTDIPEVGIDEFLFSGKKLNFHIRDFQKQKNNHQKNGKLIVNVRVKDGLNRMVWNKTQQLTSVDDTVRVSINFGWLNRGNYTILANVTDGLTGRSSFEYLKIEVR